MTISSHFNWYTQNELQIKSCQGLPVDIKKGIWNLPDVTLSFKMGNVVPSKGSDPHTNTYRTTPKLCKMKEKWRILHIFLPHLDKILQLRSIVVYIVVSEHTTLSLMKTTPDSKRKRERLPRQINQEQLKQIVHQFTKLILIGAKILLTTRPEKIQFSTQYNTYCVKNKKLQNLKLNELIRLMKPHFCCQA